MNRSRRLLGARLRWVLLWACLPVALAAADSPAASANAPHLQPQTPPGTGPAPAAAPVPTAPAAPAASAPVASSAPAAAPVITDPVIRVGFDGVEVGAMVLYRVGAAPAPGVVSREPYKIRYELLRLTPFDATLARTTLSIHDRELARELFTVPRYARLPRQAAPATATTQATAGTVAGLTLPCRRVEQVWQVAGRPQRMTWLLSPQVPLTGLIATQIDGVDHLELLAFSRGGSQADPALAAAATAAAAAAVATAPPASAPGAVPARAVNRTEDLPPGTVIVDPHTGVIITVPAVETPDLPPGDFELEGAPATP